jgi:2-polyprenyl-3-methyl-5-hydroxy-6-metoxy-1,4-benzoquinol methylase
MVGSNPQKENGSFDPEWEKIHQKQEWGSYPNEELIRFVAKNFYNVPDRSEIKILELGCGSGANIWYLSREGFSAYGIDGSKTAIERCDVRLKKEGLNANLVLGDFVDLSVYEDLFFDSVIDISSIQHNSFENVTKITNNVYSKLKNGGKFFALMVSESSNLANNKYGFVYMFTEEEIRMLMRPFSEVKIGKIIIENNGRYHKSFIVEGKK